MSSQSELDFLDFLEEALNGHNYIGSQEGELLEQSDDTTIYINAGLVTANKPLEVVKNAKEESLKFIMLNATTIITNANKDPSLSDVKNAIIVAFHRLCAIEAGLISEKFDHKTYYVNYNEAKRVDENKLAPKVTIVDVMKYLTKDVVEFIVHTFTDRVCLVAYVFRVRGHHWTEHLEELYKRIWDKCRYPADKVYIPWRLIARAAYHAILPVILDDYYAECYRTGKVNGALLIRFESAPAGSAGPHVLAQGVRDLQMVAPGIKAQLDESMVKLDMILNELKKHRFNGSVNARYYGASRVAIQEKELGAVAATILAALEGLASDAPLAKSNALRRIANNAPITGAVLGKAISKISDRPEVTNALMGNTANK